MVRLFFCILLGASTAVGAATTSPVLRSLPNVSFPAPNRVASGHLRASDIALLKQAGIRHVIDLSADEETPDFDEANAVRSAGIDYRNLPIRGAADLTHANIVKFDGWLHDAGNEPTLVHCASSNRVGAMMALRASMIGGQTDEAALAEGRRWGLKSLEPAVRHQLDAHRAPLPIR